jgi:hypothetical protein
MLAGMLASLVSTLVDSHSLYDRIKVAYVHNLNAAYETELAKHPEMVKE